MRGPGSRPRTSAAAWQKIEDESTPPLTPIATGPLLRSRRSTAVAKSDRNASQYSANDPYVIWRVVSKAQWRFRSIRSRVTTIRWPAGTAEMPLKHVRSSPDQ